jgi:hypothetical protein
LEQPRALEQARPAHPARQLHAAAEAGPAAVPPPPPPPPDAAAATVSVTRRRSYQRAGKWMDATPRVLTGPTAIRRPGRRRGAVSRVGRTAATKCGASAAGAMRGWR